MKHWIIRVGLLLSLLFLPLGCAGDECVSDEDCPTGDRCSHSQGVFFGSAMCIAGGPGLDADVPDSDGPDAHNASEPDVSEPDTSEPDADVSEPDVDPGPPEIVIVHRPDPVHYFQETTFEVSCTTPDCELRCNLGLPTVVDCDGGPVSLTLPFGSYTLEVVAEDGLGRTDDLEISWTSTKVGTFVTASGDGTVKKFSPQGEHLWTYQNELPDDPHPDMNDSVMAVVVDPDGFVYVGGHQNQRVIKLTADGEPIWISQIEELEGLRIRGIAVDPEGRVFAAGNDDGVVGLDSDGQVIWHFQGNEDQVYKVTVDADGRVYSVSADGRLRRHNPTHGNVQMSYNFGSSVRALAVSPDGQAIYVGGNENVVYMLDSDGDVVQTFDHDTTLYQIALHADGHLYAAARAASVRRLSEDFSSEWCYGTVEGHEHEISGCPGTFTNRLSVVAVGPADQPFVVTLDGMVHQLSPEGDLLWEEQVHDQVIHDIAVDPGRYDTFPDAWADQL